MIYEYKCENCGEMEIEQSIKDDTLEKCPKCESESFQRIISGVGFLLNGSGWYRDGY